MTASPIVDASRALPTRCLSSVTDEMLVGTDECKGGDVPMTVYTAGTGTMEGGIKQDPGINELLPQ